MCFANKSPNASSASCCKLLPLSPRKQVERLLSFRIKADQFADHYNQRSVLAKAKELRDRLTGMIEDDVTAFNAVMGR